MRRYRTEIDNVRAHLRSLWTVIGLQFIVILVLWFGWSQAPKQLTVHVPPDLRSGATLSVNEAPAANVYAFAFYIFQQLNRWPEDGAKDYGKAIFRISPYAGTVTTPTMARKSVLQQRRGNVNMRIIAALALMPIVLVVSVFVTTSKCEHSDWMMWFGVRCSMQSRTPNV